MAEIAEKGMGGTLRSVTKREEGRRGGEIKRLVA